MEIRITPTMVSQGVCPEKQEKTNWLPRPLNYPTIPFGAKISELEYGCED
jgi:hypothetical protein